VLGNQAGFGPLVIVS